jgi:DNA-binding CsgD family transcriptional regulator
MSWHADSRPTLHGRHAECAALDRAIADGRNGRSSTLVLRGEPGIGKTALLNYATHSAAGFRLLYASGVESEMELAFAGLHQLCAPVLGQVGALPAPQRSALDTVFGNVPGPPPDRFLIGLAVLSLLSDLSGEQPLLCVVDDTQWLDRASAEVIGFVARRMMAESVTLLFGAREPRSELAGLPELEVTGLRDADARELLAPRFRFARDDSAHLRILAEAGGNPLALLELPWDLAGEQSAEGATQRADHPLSRQVEDSFLGRVDELPDHARLLLLLAAAEPVGDPVLFWRAVEHLDIDAGAAGSDEFRALLTIDGRVAFRHPLVRSAVYRAATGTDRRRVHLALSVVTDQQIDPDRRAWHLASAAVGPDESVAEELERAAGRAQARGGLAAAAAFLRRSVALTEETTLRVGRALTASQASLHAGEFDLALRMLIEAEAEATQEAQQARALLLRGQIAFASGHGADAAAVLLSAADQFQALDLKVARETYLEAWGAALFAGELAADTSLMAASEAAMSLPPLQNPGPSDVLLEGLATLIAGGRIAAAPILRRATAAFAAADAPVEENFRWGWLTTVPSNVLWDEQAWDTINVRQLGLARSVGALARLPIDLTAMAILVAWRGDFAAAAAAVAETDSVVEATGTQIAPFGAMLLAALRGREAEATALSDAAVGATAGRGISAQYARWVTAILFNSLGRYEEALDAARQASDESPRLFLAAWALPELIEASARTDNAEIGRDALERLAEAAAAAATDWALGIEARSRALLSEGDAAETCYQEAVERLARTQLRPELARAHLLYGEWLRRQGRRVDARLELRTAYDTFVDIGMEAFAERSRHELLATGETVRKRTEAAVASDDLTAQERQIALLVRGGLSNQEVGIRLFVSPRTVEWHLRKVFTKLSITSRRQLRDVLIGPERMPTSA